MSDRQLLKAARRGNLAMARDALAAGAVLECRDLNQMTPLMLAAQGAHGEVFAALVEAGGDLRATALGQTDLLECAAEGGDVGIIQLLLEKGLAIEGQWQPRSQAEKRLGHLTPLLMAAINGHVEAVQILLKAGANRKAEFDGQTAAQFMAAGIGNPNGDKEAALGARYAAIGELLQEKGTSGA